MALKRHMRKLFSERSGVSQSKVIKTNRARKELMEIVISPSRQDVSPWHVKSLTLARIKQGKTDLASRDRWIP